MIKKAVIPAAGKGTRLLPATKETPKEMLPIFTLSRNGEICVKPLLQAVFEQLYDFGIREFCFIVGRGKGSITDHFATDRRYLQDLSENGKQEIAEELLNFFNKVTSSSLVFVNQPEPKGFGDAILRARPYVHEPFIVQAGDTYIMSRENHHLSRLHEIYDEFESDAIFYIQEVEDPSSFGIIIGDEIEDGIYQVNKVMEKPTIPPTNLAITALYLFTPNIFRALESIFTGLEGEFQLTDGIQKLLDLKFKVLAVQLNEDDLWLDIGSPKSYWEALISSYQFFQR